MAEVIILLPKIFSILKTLKGMGDNSAHLIPPNSLNFPQTTTIFSSQDH